MFSKEINALAQKSLEARNLPVPQVIGGKNLRYDIDDMVAMILPQAKLAVVADHDTGNALGEHVLKALSGRFTCSYIHMGKSPSADDRRVSEVCARAEASDALVAVGSGTVGDICKYAAFKLDKPYIAFPTAASMNGYLSANASITVNGYKKTLPARMPVAVFCDFSVIAAAPSRLNKAGLGDSLARPCAQADWLLSHLLLNTPYDETPFTLLAPSEPALYASAAGIAKGDLESLSLLMNTLLLSGLGMTIAHGSYPASGGEHMVAHAYGMLRKAAKPATLHGEEIGVTALLHAERQRRLLAQAPALQPLPYDRPAMALLFGEAVAGEAQISYAAKRDACEAANLRDEVLKQRWDMIAEAVSKVVLPPEAIAAVLRAAEAPDRIESLGWNSEAYGRAQSHARFLRDRFTTLDLRDQ